MATGWTRIIKEFEEQFLEIKDDDDHFYHDQGRSMQTNFRMKVVSLVEAFEDVGNPLLDQSEDMSTLDMGIIMERSVVDTVFTIETVGREQFNKYYKSVLVDGTNSIHNLIK